MSKTSNWQPDEDKALLEIYRDRNVKKWAKISFILLNDYGIRKSPKKCRERYKNHLNPEINKDEWSLQEKKDLVQLQRELGNRWAQIARRLSGRTDNSVKNKFYSIFRHAVSKINSTIQQVKNGDFREIQMSFIYKLILLVDNKFKSDHQVSEDLIREAEGLKSKILDFQIAQPLRQHIDMHELSEIKARAQFINEQFKKKVLRKKKRRTSAKKEGQSTDLRLPTEHSELFPTPIKKEPEGKVCISPEKIPGSPLLVLPPSVEKLCLKVECEEGEPNWVGDWNHDDSELWRQDRGYSSPLGSF